MGERTRQWLVVAMLGLGLGAALTARQAAEPPEVLITRADSAPESADPSYGTQGVATLPGGFGVGFATAEVTSRGAVFSVCQETAGRFSTRFVRLTPLGIVDATFGIGGIANFEPEPGLGGCATVAGEDSVGRLVLVGWAGTGPQSSAAYAFLARLLPDGRWDPSFNGGTPRRIALSSPLFCSPGAIPAHSLTVPGRGAVAIDEDDGMFVAAGCEYTYSAQSGSPPQIYRTGAKAVLLRFTAAGVPDNSFASAGRWLAAHEPNPFRIQRIGYVADCDDGGGVFSDAWANPATSVFVLPGRQLVIGGSYNSEFCFDLPLRYMGSWLARYNPDLTPNQLWGVGKFVPAIGVRPAVITRGVEFSRTGHGILVGDENASGGSARLFLVAPDGNVHEPIDPQYRPYSLGGRLAQDGTAMVSTIFQTQPYNIQPRTFLRFLPGGQHDGWFAANEIDGGIIGGVPDPYSAGIPHLRPHAVDAEGRWYGWSNRGFSRTRRLVAPLTTLAGRANVALPRIAISVRDKDSPATAFTVSVRSSNQAVIADSDFTLVGMRPETPPQFRTRWYLDIARPSRQAGSSTVSVDVSDGSHVTTQTFEVTISPAPVPPSNLRALSAAGSVQLSWDPANSGPVPERYVVSYGPAQGRYTSARGVSHPETSLTISGLAFGRYYASVVATTGGGALISPPSNEVAFDISSTTSQVLNPPNNLVAAAAGRTVTVSWRPPSDGLVPASYRLEAGFAPGQVAASLPISHPQTTVTVPGVGDGRYFLRVRALAANLLSLPSSEVVIDVPGGIATPSEPRGLRATVRGQVIDFAWEPSMSSGAAVISSYLIDAGSSPGASDLAAGLALGPGTAFTSPPLPAGTYFVRVRAQNAVGNSAPSNEVTAVVRPSPLEPPELMGQGGPGGAVWLSWSRPSSGAEVTGYELQAGGSPGASNLAVIPLGASHYNFATGGVPPGVYYVRVVPTRGSVRGPASNEVTVVVP